MARPIPFVDPPFEADRPQTQVASSQGTDTSGQRASQLLAATSERLTIIEGLLRKAPRLKPLAMNEPSDSATKTAGSY